VSRIGKIHQEFSFCSDAEAFRDLGPRDITHALVFRRATDVSDDVTDRPCSPKGPGPKALDL
jgi:hypothetical protein